MEDCKKGSRSTSESLANAQRRVRYASLNSAHKIVKSIQKGFPVPSLGHRETKPCKGDARQLRSRAAMIGIWAKIDNSNEMKCFRNNINNAKIEGARFSEAV
jgi:hypothetical protein